MTVYYVLAKWPGQGREAGVIGTFELPQDGYFDATPEAQRKLLDLLSKHCTYPTEVFDTGLGYKLENGVEFYVQSLPVQTLDFWIERGCKFKNKV